MLARAVGATASGGKQHFTDVPQERWSFESIGALVEARIINPDDYGTAFNPTTPITRAEIATMLVRAGGFEKELGKKASLISFSDPIPEWAKGYVTVALNHGLITGYYDGAFRPGGKATRAEAGLMVLRLIDPAVRPAAWVEKYTYGNNTLQVIRVNFNRPDIEIKPALAGTIKDTAHLGEIAEREGAIAAINGTYFSAYNNNNGDFGEPFNALCIDGEWIHLQFSGTALGITHDKRIIMDPIRPMIEGSTNGRKGEWGAWSLNHTASNIVGIFTPRRGATTGMTDGITFTVVDGKIVSKSGPDVPIPENGYVIFVSNSRVNQWTNSLFPVGGRVDYKVVFWDHKDRPYPNAKEWEGIKHSLGCGPRLVTNGALSVNPVAEGYTDEKQNTLSANRGAVGVTKDNIVMFVTCTSMTPQQFGEAMLDLGSWNAMQMDSGGSSALWYDGKYLTGPGRKVNNGLVVIQKK